MRFFLAITLALCATALSKTALADPPKIATFPLGGTSSSDLRDRVGYSIRVKLDRDGAYDPIDGPTMLDIASLAKAPIDFNTTPDVLKDLAQGSDAVVFIWGDLSPAGGGDVLRLKTLDLREKDPQVRTFQRPIPSPEQIRFVVEAFLQTLPGVTPFTPPSETPVHHDQASDDLFAVNPNLVINGDFSAAGHWNAILLFDKYPPPLSDNLPGPDQVVICRQSADGGKTFNNVLAMNMSYKIATTNGLACLSDAIDIQPATRYRLTYRYRSTAPTLQVLVKGYTAGKDLTGQPADQEIYRLQVPPGRGTGENWKTVEADINPRNPDFPVQRLRIDLYIYEHPGMALFDDVVLKAIGRQSTPATKP